MSFKAGTLLYEGKAKKIFSVQDRDDCLWLEFKNSLTAFNAQKKGQFSGKGQINRDIASAIFRYLQNQGIHTHWVADVGDIYMVCRKVEIVPLEVVIRNRLAGSTAKKFNIEEGLLLDRPLLEFYYKNDELGDPFISDEQALILGFVKNQKILDQIKKVALAINQQLLNFFAKIGIDLVDFKMEFGLTGQGEILLADEISPDSCRLWDAKTQEKLDKDRFRRDLGKVEDSYLEVLNRIKNVWGDKI